MHNNNEIPYFSKFSQEQNQIVQNNNDNISNCKSFSDTILDDVL
jgi:hypothetical protein